MTAVEWFWIHLPENISKEYFDLFEQAKEMEKQIADDYVVEFTEWMYKYKCDKNGIKELLEIFKKEKGL